MGWEKEKRVGTRPAPSGHFLLRRGGDPLPRGQVGRWPARDGSGGPRTGHVPSPSLTHPGHPRGRGGHLSPWVSPEARGGQRVGTVRCSQKEGTTCCRSRQPQVGQETGPGGRRNSATVTVFSHPRPPSPSRPQPPLITSIIAAAVPTTSPPSPKTGCSCHLHHGHHRPRRPHRPVSTPLCAERGPHHCVPTTPAPGPPTAPRCPPSSPRGSTWSILTREAGEDSKPKP